MEEKRRVVKEQALAIVSMMLVMMLSSMVSPGVACSPSKNRKGCKDCVADQMKYGCPSCVPVLQCMAKCLWGGSSRTTCIQKCDCNGGKPKLSDCKKCMSRCKCSCVA